MKEIAPQTLMGVLKLTGKEVHQCIDAVVSDAPSYAMMRRKMMVPTMTRDEFVAAVQFAMEAFDDISQDDLSAGIASMAAANMALANIAKIPDGEEVGEPTQEDPAPATASEPAPATAPEPATTPAPALVTNIAQSEPVVTPDYPQAEPTMGNIQESTPIPGSPAAQPGAGELVSSVDIESKGIPGDAGGAGDGLSLDDLLSDL